MALGSTQPLTEMSTRNISGGVKAARAWGWPYHLHVLTVLKSGSLNFLEPSGPAQACNGIALPFTFNLTALIWYTQLQISLDTASSSWRHFIVVDRLTITLAAWSELSFVISGRLVQYYKHFYTPYGYRTKLTANMLKKILSSWFRAS